MLISLLIEFIEIAEMNKLLKVEMKGKHLEKNNNKRTVEISTLSENFLLYLMQKKIYKHIVVNASTLPGFSKPLLFYESFLLS